MRASAMRCAVTSHGWLLNTWRQEDAYRFCLRMERPKTLTCECVTLQRNATFSRAGVMGRTRESPCTDRLLKQWHGKAAADLVLGSGNTHEGNCDTVHKMAKVVNS